MPTIKNNLMRATYLLIFTGLVACNSTSDNNPKVSTAKDGWINLFNGKDLTGWVPKFNGHKVGENYLNTFKVEDGKLIVSYDEHTSFDDKFGHLFYTNKTFSHYTIRAEYRFVGEQISGGPDWAYRNNGLMLHSEDPYKMNLVQSFPTSMETQLLGGNGKDYRNTGNICSIATHIVLDGKLDTRHCISSSSKTYHGDQWVTVEVEVHGHEKIIHRINGEKVFEYTDAQYDPNEAQGFIDKTGSIYLGEGYIAIQAESHPTEFRSIMVKEHVH